MKTNKKTRKPKFVTVIEMNMWGNFGAIRCLVANGREVAESVECGPRRALMRDIRALGWDDNIDDRTKAKKKEEAK